MTEETPSPPPPTSLVRCGVFVSWVGCGSIENEAGNDQPAPVVPLHVTTTRNAPTSRKSAHPFRCNRKANLPLQATKPHLTRNFHHQTRRHADALGDPRDLLRNMRGNVRVLFLPVQYCTEAASITDAVWPTTPEPLSFAHGFDLGVSSVVFRSVPHTADCFASSPFKSCRAHELIVERFGKSVRVQGDGPVSTSRTLHAMSLYLNPACSGTSDYSRSIPSPSVTS